MDGAGGYRRTGKRFLRYARVAMPMIVRIKTVVEMRAINAAAKISDNDLT